MPYREGIRAENHFAKLLNEQGVEHEFIDLWYDFFVAHKVKVEVKSCELSINNGSKHRTTGRFHFTSEENRRKLWDEKVWLCFIVSHKGDFLFLGLQRADKLPERHELSIHDVVRAKPKPLLKWLSEAIL